MSIKMARGKMSDSRTTTYTLFLIMPTVLTRVGFLLHAERLEHKRFFPDVCDRISIDTSGTEFPFGRSKKSARVDTAVVADVHHRSPCLAGGGFWVTFAGVVRRAIEN